MSCFIIWCSHSDLLLLLSSPVLQELVVFRVQLPSVEVSNHLALRYRFFQLSLLVLIEKPLEQSRISVFKHLHLLCRAQDMFVAEFLLQDLARHIVVNLLNVGAERVTSSKVGNLADDVTYFVLRIFVLLPFAYLRSLAFIKTGLDRLQVARQRAKTHLVVHGSTRDAVE